MASQLWRLRGGGGGGIDLEVMVVGILIMVMVQQSVQLRSNHPLHDDVDDINKNGGPYIGLVMTFPTELLALQDSGLFFPSSNIPFVDLAGRRFNIGSIVGVNVIYVMTGEKTLNAGITVQILVDTFDIKGIVHYGIAGSANESLTIGDVSVPKYVAFTSSWDWMEFESEENDLPEFIFGNYNFPKQGENLLAKVEFTAEQLYSTGKPMEQVFWLPVEPNWFTIASQLKDIELQRCINETYCLPNTPKVVYGLKGSTADIFLDNAAYGKFLFDKFNVSTVDEESAAVVMTCLSNGVPCIVFRGVSDMSGGGGTEGKLSATSVYSLASINALSVAVEFIGSIGKNSSVFDQ